MKASAIVVTYNRINKLQNCLNHLLNQGPDLNNIIVINNNSTDGTKRYLAKLNNDKIIVRNLSKNVGGAGGFSAGIKFAYEQTDSDYFWLMDDDSIPTPTSLSTLASNARKLNGNFGFLCSNVRLINSNYPSNIPKPSHDWDELLPSNLVKIESATFVSYMVPRKIVRKLGLPVKQMFIWGDDYEYSLRISTHKPCYFVTNSIVIHDSKTYSSKNSIFLMPSNRDIYLKCSLRNSLYAIRKHKGAKDIIKKVLSDLYLILKVPFVSKRTRARKMIYMLSGLIQGFFFNPIIEFPKSNVSKH